VIQCAHATVDWVLVQFNSVGNVAGLFGPWVIGVVVGRTCSYNLAFYIMGTVLLCGGGLVQLVKDERKKVDEPGPLAPKTSYVELAGASMQGSSRNGSSLNRSSLNTSLHQTNIDLAAGVEES
jgi:hypothetical protein